MKKKTGTNRKGIQKKIRKQRNYLVLFFVSFFLAIFIGSLFLSGIYIFRIVEKNDKTEIPDAVLSSAQSQEISVIPFPGKEPITSQTVEDVQETMEDAVMTMAFAGDVMFDDSYSIMNYYRSVGGEITKCFDETLLDYMKQADLFMVNNECTFTNRGTPTEGKTYTFRSDPQNAKILQDMGVDLVSLANNHAYDYGEISILDTMDTLTGSGIEYVGAGTTLDEAKTPFYYEIEGTKVAIVAATQIERMPNPDTKGATQNSPGVFRCFEPELLCEVIKTAKENSDFVIVYVHWGAENTTEIDWAQRDQAILFEEAGADLIVGDHPHCLQGITYINDTPVIYSLGNFWFNSKTVDTGLLQIAVKGNSLEQIQFIPCRQQSCRTLLLSGQDRDHVLSQLRTLSPEVMIDENGNLEKMK